MHLLVLELVRAKGRNFLRMLRQMALAHLHPRLWLLRHVLERATPTLLVDADIGGHKERAASKKKREKGRSYETAVDASK